MNTYIDRLALLKRVDGDTELLQSIIEAFFETYQVQLQSISSNLAAVEFRSAEISCHSLNGALQTFFKGELVDLAQACERACAAGNLEDALSKLSALESGFERSTEVIEQLCEYLE